MQQHLLNRKLMLAYLERVQQIIEDQEPSAVRNQMQHFFGHSIRVQKLAEALKSNEGCGRFMTIIEGFAANDRASVANHLIGNQPILAALIDADQYDRLRGLIPDRPVFAAQRIKLITRPEVVAYLIKSKRADELLGQKNGQVPPGDRYAILNGILQSQSAVAAIIKAGKLDDLLETIRSTGEAKSQTLIRRLLSQPPLLAEMIRLDQLSSLFEMMETLRDYEQARLLLSIIKQLDEVDLSQASGVGLQLWKRVAEAADPGHRRLAANLIAAKWFRDHVTRHNLDDGTFAKALAAAPKDLQQMCLQSSLRLGLSQFAVNGQLKLLKTIFESQPTERVDEAATVVSSSYYLPRDAKDPGILVLLRFVEPIKSPKLKAAFLRQLATHRDCFRYPNNERIAEAIIKFGEQHADLAPSLCASMLRNRLLRDAAMKSPLMPRFVKSLDQIENSDTRFLLESLLSKSTAEALVKAGQGRKLIEVIMKVSVPAARRSSLRSRMLMEASLLELMTDEEITAAFRDLTQKDEEALIKGPTVPMMIQRGYFPQLRMIAMHAPAKYGRSSAWQFYIQDNVVDTLRESNESSRLLVDMLKESRDHDLRRRLAELHRKNSALAWILDEFGWQAIDKQIDRLDAERDRKRYGEILRFSSAHAHYCIVKRSLAPALKGFSEEQPSLLNRRKFMSDLCRIPEITDAMESNEFAGMFLQLLESLVGEGHRQVFVSSLTGNRKLCRAICRNGGADTLVRLIKLNVPPEQRRKSAGSDFIQQTISDAVAEDITAGRLESADKMLRSYSRDDRGKQRYAMFAHRTGRLQQAIDTTRASITAEQDASVKADLQRLLFYLLRLHDSKQATDLAMESGDSLAWFYAIERFDWEAARGNAVPAQESIDGPVQENAAHAELERLSCKTVVARFAGDAHAAASGRTELSSWFDNHPRDDLGVRLAACALMLNDCPGEARKLLERRRVKTAMLLQWDRQFYDPALKLIHWDAKRADECFDRFSKNAKGYFPERMDGARYMLQVASLLDEVGRTEEADAAYNAVISYPQRDRRADPRQVSRYRNLVASLLYSHGKRELAWQALVGPSGRVSPTQFFYTIYRTSEFDLRAHDAGELWKHARQHFPDENVVTGLERVDRIITGRASKKEALKATKQEIEDWAPLPDLREVPFADVHPRKKISRPLRLPSVYYRYGKFRECRQQIADWPKPTAAKRLLSARAAMASKQFPLAAKEFRELWNDESDDAFLLYFCGLCEQHFDAKKGDNTIKLARQIAVSEEATAQLADMLQLYGFTGEALKIYGDLQKLAPLGSVRYLHALWNLAARAEDPALMRDRWRQHELLRLRISRSTVPVQDFQKAIVRDHGLNAEIAIDKDKFDLAENHWLAARRVNGAAHWLAETLVPLLRAKGQNELADKIYQAHHRYLKARVDKFADSTALKSRLSALESKCGPTPK